jgi:GT2 family glycosyltransferase
MRRPRVSIVLPTYGREELLCQALRDLLRLDYPEYEIIVVDQTPRHSPETQHYLSEIQDRIRYFRQAQPSVVMAANRGARLAGGEIVLFVDDDNRVPDPQFITGHAESYDDPSVGGVAGRVLDALAPREGTFDPRSADPFWGFFYTGWEHPTPCEVTTAPGANMSFRRELILSQGGFDERFFGTVRWENDFCLRLRKAGHRVVYNPIPTVHHFYGSPGGNDNRHLHGREPASHGWYRSFFHNQVYFALKHMPRASIPRLLWRLYRSHVLNRPYAREGATFLSARHRALVAGLLLGWATYRQWRLEAGRPLGRESHAHLR